MLCFVKLEKAQWKIYLIATIDVFSPACFGLKARNKGSVNDKRSLIAW